MKRKNKFKHKELPPLTDESGEVRELTAEDFRQMRPIHEVLPKPLVKMLLKQNKKIFPQQSSKSSVALQYQCKN